MGLKYLYIILFVLLFNGFAYGTECFNGFSTMRTMDWLNLKVTEDSHVIKSIGKADRTEIDPEKPLKILVWNVYKGLKENFWSDLTELLSKVDVGLLQESVIDEENTKCFQSRTGFEFTFATSFENPYNSETGVTTASRIQTTLQRYIRSPDFEPLTNTPKLVLITEYKIKGRTETLLVVNLHAINFVDPKSFSRQLLRVQPVLQKHKGPIIVGGDFNTHDPRRNSVLKRFVETNHLYSIAISNDSRWFPLDYLFVRGFEKTTGRLLVDVESSDHYPILSEIYLL